jgi:hypothetical protein
MVWVARPPLGGGGEHLKQIFGPEGWGLARRGCRSEGCVSSPENAGGCRSGRSFAWRGPSRSTVCGASLPAWPPVGQRSILPSSNADNGALRSTEIVARTRSGRVNRGYAALAIYHENASVRAAPARSRDGLERLRDDQPAAQLLAQVEAGARGVFASDSRTSARRWASAM